VELKSSKYNELMDNKVRQVCLFNAHAEEIYQKTKQRSMEEEEKRIESRQDKERTVRNSIVMK